MPIASLCKLINPSPDGGPKTGRIIVDGVDVPVTFRHNARARRIILRIDKKGDGVVLTIPPGTSRSAALDFAARQATWIRSHLQRRIDKVNFTHGALLPVRGDLHCVDHRPHSRGTVWIEERSGDEVPLLCVSGAEAHVPRRVRDWLKRQARADLNRACEHYASAMGLRYARISIRDQSSRWGSCSSSGGLSFSWRLVLASGEVLDYVAAHEVAHLQEMNHGPDFWALVESHCPQTRTARRWLKKDGADLHRYGE
jgi:predicted metal-dependent hydrolase